MKESTLHDYINALATFTALLSIDGTLILVNHSAANATGIPIDEFIGKSFKDCYWWNFSEASQDDLVKDIIQSASGIRVDREVEIRVVNDVRIIIRFLLTPIINKKGEVVNLVAEGQDITALKKQEEDLRNAMIAAEAATIAKTQFLASMSHEIRTPMNGVIGMAELLEDTPLNNQQKDYLAAITSSGNSLLSIINDILDFSKLDADMAELESIPFDLELVTQECMELVLGNNKVNTLEFILDYHPDCLRHFIGDPSRIRQILINLIGNAAKFTDEGFIRCGVSTELIDNGEEQLRIEIQDTGIGLKEEAITHLFDEFTQADNTTTRKYGGTGLGLAITKKLVKLTQGEIGVDSVYGEGTTFWITLKLPKAEQPAPIDTSALDGVRILFVNDNNENCRILGRMFEHMGTDTTILTDTTKVTDTLLNAESENRPFKMAILGHNMAGISGMELGINIRGETKLNGVKLLIFSPIGQKGDASIFAQAGFNAYLNRVSRYETIQNILSATLLHTTGDSIITQHSIKNFNQSHDKKLIAFNASILLAEDILVNQIIAETLLTDLGVDVDVVNNGEEAFTAYNKKHYDLIFMDCLMPEMDGYQATKAIREFEKEKNKTPVTIIALTANASNDDRVLCLQSGMDDVVTKPFNREDLSNCLQKWLPSLLKNNEAGDIKNSS